MKSFLLFRQEGFAPMQALSAVQAPNTIGFFVGNAARDSETIA